MFSGLMSLCSSPTLCSSLRFLAEFYTEALAGMLINMFTGDLEYDREDVQKNVILVLKTAIPSALLAKEQDMDSPTDPDFLVLPFFHPHGLQGSL